MSSILKKALELVVGEGATAASFRLPGSRPLKKLTERELLQLESQIGARIFGPVASGRRREFFCLDETTWLWHEEGPNPKTGQREEITTRYEVQDKGVLKVQQGSRYSYIEGEELANLALAARMYHEQVARGVYNRDPQTGQKLG